MPFCYVIAGFIRSMLVHTGAVKNELNYYGRLVILAEF